MVKSNLLGGAELAAQRSGKNTDALGPSDNSDSGSDVQGVYGDDERASDSDAAGTGERGSISSAAGQPGADILPDRIEGGEAASQDAPLFDDASDVDNLAADDSDPAQGLAAEDPDSPPGR
jgi:hypothetical protein